MDLERDLSLIRVCLRDHVGSKGLWSAVGREVVGSYLRNRGEVRRVDVWSRGKGLERSKRTGSRRGGQCLAKTTLSASSFEQIPQSLTLQPSMVVSGKGNARDVLYSPWIPRHPLWRWRPSCFFMFYGHSFNIKSILVR